MKENGRIMRTKIILAILGVTILAGGVIFYFYRPFGQAVPVMRYSIELIATPISLPADGVSQTQIVAKVHYTLYKKGPQYTASGVSVNFTTNLGRLTTTQAVTDKGGQAIVYLKSAQEGQATVSASVGTTASQTIKISFTNVGGSQVLFSDDFSKDLSKWQIVYDGYGYVKIENGALALKPKAATTPSETHAGLATAGSSTWADYNLELKMKTISQLRQGSVPNAWEVGWVLFRYVDAQNFYYLIYKPNGVELGRLDAGQQVFLQTPNSPKLTLNNWDTIKISLKGANIKVDINGARVIDFTDPRPVFPTGKIALYCEDAYVQFDDVLVTSN